MPYIRITRSQNEEEKLLGVISPLKGILFFRPELPFKSTIIDKEFVISINEVKGILATPRYPDEFPHNSKMSPLQNPKSFDLSLDNVYWGSICTWPKGDCKVSSLFIKIILEGNFSNTNKLLLDLESWHQRFLDNLTTVSGYNVRKNAKVVTSGNIGIDKFELYSNNQMVIDYDEAGVKVHVPDRKKEHGIGFEELKQAIDLTSAGKKPLLEFYFFMDAVEAFQDENYRKAILDAATAIELSLNNLIKKALPVEEHFKNEVLKNYYSFPKKRQLCKALNISLPKHQYDIQFDKFRNAAIHNGKFPTRNEARTALEIINDVLNNIIDDKFETI